MTVRCRAISGLKGVVGILLVLMCSLTSSGVTADSLTLDFTAPQGHWGVVGTDDIPLIASGEGFCYVSAVAGDFGGDSEVCRVYEDNGEWWLQYGCGTDECGCWATCMKLPANRTYGQVVDVQGLSGSGTATAKTGLKTSESICAITEISGNYAGSGELCEIIPCTDDTSEWCLYKTSGQSVFGCGIKCLYMPTPNWDPSNGIGGTDNFKVVTGAVGDADPINSHYTDNEAMLGLWQVGGNFAGSGEYCGVYVSGGYWMMWVKSGQSTMRCGANYGVIPDNGWASAKGYWDFMDEVLNGEISWSLEIGIVSTDSMSLTEEWGVSATAAMSEDLMFLDKSVSVTAWESMSVEVEKSISVGAIETKTITCPIKDGYPYVSLYQWSIDLYHNGIGDPSTVKTSIYQCQYQTYTDRKNEPRCPPDYCRNAECSVCTSIWWDTNTTQA